MAEFDTIIQGGMVVDGTRLPRYRADVGIKDGKIAKIGQLKSHRAKKIIDAGGQFVVPGFVDLHTHYDAQLFWVVVRLRGVRSVLRVLTWASTAPTGPQGPVRDGVFRPCLA
jgi:N-acyl-D-aspartate/D-glutamate deacylase